jgi:hypothetical protein
VRQEVESAHLIVFNTLIDKERKGHASLEDYLEYFKECYHGGLPFTHEDICYMFKRHDRFRQGRVVSSDFLREIAPLATHIEPENRYFMGENVQSSVTLEVQEQRVMGSP